VSFGRVGSSSFERITREHAWVLACACAAILLLGLPFPANNPGALVLPGNRSSRNEAELDSELQSAAMEALGQREGAVIVLDAQTGRVRALVNPDVAYRQAQMPGSAIKPFTALAALRAGLIDENSRTVCPGRFTGLSFSLACVHADHLPPFSPSQAIAYSCNYYFATLGQKLGREQLLATLRQFGFGQVTGVSDKETAGLARPCETGNRARLVSANHVSTDADCDAREALGESDHLQVTPVQLLAAYTALINGGHLFEVQQADAAEFQPAERAAINITNEQRAIIAEGMAGAIRYGTARSAKLDSLPLTILGKTGTALPARGFRTNGWFAGLAGPFQSKRELDPSQVELAVLVVLAHAHGAEAAAAARPIFAAFANNIRDLETSTAAGSENKPDPAGASSRSAATSFRVHLVHDNVTEELSLEDYVLGVMRAEGTTETELEALKALAIAIRTYALKNVGRHAKDGYDFCSTTHCQRFVSVRSPTVREGPNVDGALPNGRASDTNLVTAVRATEGQVLRDHQGEVVDAYFGASCGGETANIGDLWGITPPEYLRGVRDEYCEDGPHAKWTDTISRADLLRALHSDSRTDVGSHLDNVSISKRDDTGRAEFIRLDGEQPKTVRGWDFKIIVGRVLGWNVLKSSRFEITRSGSNFIFHGSGFGHGLGLCQEGAHVMAARGANYQKILEKYFPGTNVRARNGSVSLVRPVNGGEEMWRADLLPASRVARPPRSGQIFIVQDQKRNLELRGSETFDSHFYFAPTELANFSETRVYKHLLPTGATLTAKFLTISSEHFRVTYPADVDRRDADQVLNTLESARSDFVQRASSASISINIPALEIRLNESTGDFTSRTGQPWWAAAATKGNRIELQPVGILKRRGVLANTLRHELAHTIIDSISSNRAARWLGEGFAVYLAGEGPSISRYAPARRLSVDELEQRLERPGSQKDMRALYAESYLAVMDLVRSQGEASVWKSLSRG
jgi:SpoIID/LytB domain protein